ncbi:MAG: energy-coupling factor ABC transporter ATP-binding protein [Dehalococcoidia bacterium]
MSSRDVPALQVRGLRYTYPGDIHALQGIDLEVATGERVALIGPNGAGKSTLMLHLNGIPLSQQGTVEVAGLRVEKKTLARVRAEVGLVFQDPDDQLFSPSLRDDVAFGPIHMGIPEDQVTRRVADALAAVGLEGFEDRPPYALSLGQRKRAALATVLSMSPSLLVLDEPSAGLDPRGRRELINLLKSRPETMIVSTHDMRLVADVFARTVVVDGGLIVADRPTSDLLADAALLERHGLESPY